MNQTTKYNHEYTPDQLARFHFINLFHRASTLALIASTHPDYHHLLPATEQILGPMAATIPNQGPTQFINSESYYRDCADALNTAKAHMLQRDRSPKKAKTTPPHQQFNLLHHHHHQAPRYQCLRRLRHTNPRRHNPATKPITLSTRKTNRAGTPLNPFYPCKHSHQKRSKHMDAVYALTFIPLLLITLTIHELGHLITARLLRVKVSAFQIGVGRNIFARYAGNTPIRLTPSTSNHTTNRSLPQPGEMVHVHVSQADDASYTAVALHNVLPARKSSHDATDPLNVFHPITRFFRRRKPAASPMPQTLAHYNQTHMQLTGRVKTVSDKLLTIADVSWSLRAIPIMAAVFMPEDPDTRITNAYNTVPWIKKITITLAGPAANLILLAAVIITLSVLPFPTSSTPIIAIDTVTPNSPADTAGLQQGDYIIQINNILIPSKEELVLTVSQAMLTGDVITLHIRRQRENHTVQITPTTSTGLIGITLSEKLPPNPNRSIHPDAMAQRFGRLTTVYFTATISLISSIGDSDNPDPVLSSPVMTAYYTAQAVEHAKLRAWLAILAAFTLGTAILNLIPIPPLDGYRIIIHTIQALRSEPISPNLERAFTVSGLSLIVFATLYLVASDIINLLE